jgi:glycosyltransferase involved in cell wall biosynthesis
MLKRRYNVDSEVIYHGVDANTFKPRNKAQSKRELGYEETDFVVLFIGKLHPYKDPLTLIKAFSEAVKKNTNLCLAMIGEGELYQEVNKKISELNLLNRVKLFRRVSDERLKILYNAADLFVLPSVGEAFGMTLLEAMASGVPVIASNSGACLEVVGNAGILFSRGNHIELAEKILRLSHEKELSRKLSEAGMKRVRETFSWEDKIDQYLKLYKIACLSKFK